MGVSLPSTVSPATRTRRYAGDWLGLALEDERLDGLDIDRIAHEPVCEIAEQTSRGPRLLESCRDVDGIAGHQPLADVASPARPRRY